MFNLITLLAVSTLGSESTTDSWLSEFHLILGDSQIVITKSPKCLKEGEKILKAIANAAQFKILS